MKKVPMINKDVIWKKVQDEAVLLNPVNGKYFGLNCVGCSFIEKVDGIRNVEDIIDLLMDEYNIQREILAKDIAELISRMESQDILQFDN